MCEFGTDGDGAGGPDSWGVCDASAPRAAVRKDGPLLGDGDWCTDTASGCGADIASGFGAKSATGRGADTAAGCAAGTTSGCGAVTAASCGADNASGWVTSGGPMPCAVGCSSVLPASVGCTGGIARDGGVPGGGAGKGSNCWCPVGCCLMSSASLAACCVCSSTACCCGSSATGAPCRDPLLDFDDLDVKPTSSPSSSSSGSVSRP
mmetsp:Transcript_18052/g.50515  ORF Transcript_18052/g.50515 Transcript_18052/m.50515 type:complete len:207 (-) Transcript_18052:5268-5888(-)